MVKVSMHAFAHVCDQYALLHAGGALGRGCGPLVVARKDSHLRPVSGRENAAGLADALSRARVAVPGGLTTAALLAELFTGGLGKPLVMPFDRIMPAVAAGEVDAGVIIHEGRFTFGPYGLRRLLDLGEWWESTADLPLPLGGIAVRRSLPGAVQSAVERAVRASLEQARARPQTALEYALRYAQEMDAAVCAAHIELYVNEFSIDYGSEGERAIRHLLTVAGDVGVGEGRCAGLFWDDAVEPVDEDGAAAR